MTVAGNFLVLRAPIDTDEASGVREDGQELGWNRLLEQRGFSFGDEPNARIIPIPTNGVFAEAVLGRSNGAEKLEYTRFWNWQDSPIPLQPPEIAPVTTGSRATPEDLQPGQLGQPVLNIVNPTSLPDPAGLGAVLSAVANSNMFRDMSGLAGTQTLAGQTAQGTLDAATAAAEIASANMRAQMQKAVAMGQIAADLAKTAMGMPSSGGGNNTISAEAARVAHGEQRDAAGASNAPGGGDASGGGTVDGGGGSSGGGESGGITATRAMFASGSEGSAGAAAFNRALWGPLGQPAGELAQDTMAMVRELGADDGGGAAGGASGSSVSPFSEKLYATEMRPSATLNAQLATAMQTVRGTLSDANKTRLDNVSIIVVKLTPSGNIDYAGVRETDMFFSASLLKVSLLYASFELVARVNELAKGITAGSAKDFFVKVNQDFDPKIANAVPKITPGPWRKVQFNGALAATADASGKFQVTMSPRHDQDLRSIFNNQNQNVGARECMRRLGFSYVNGALEAAGFLGLATETGIWMATDYINDNPPGPGNWRSFNIPVVTNGTSSAAMTTLTMANLLNKIHRGELIDAASSQTMRDIFATGVAWLSLLADPNAFSFTEDGAKVGHDSSASARVGSVMSEAVFLKRKSDSAPFATVWQNVPDPLGAEPIYQVIERVDQKLAVMFDRSTVAEQRDWRRLKQVDPMYLTWGEQVPERRELYPFAHLDKKEFKK